MPPAVPWGAAEDCYLGPGGGGRNQPLLALRHVQACWEFQFPFISSPCACRESVEEHAWAGLTLAVQRTASVCSDWKRQAVVKTGHVNLRCDLSTAVEITKAYTFLRGGL